MGTARGGSPSGTLCTMPQTPPQARSRPALAERRHGTRLGSHRRRPPDPRPTRGRTPRTDDGAMSAELGPAVKRRLRTAIAVQIGLGVLVLAAFLWRVDILGALRNLPEIQWRFALAGTLTFSLSKFVHAYRWRWFLRHRREIPVPAAIRAVPGLEPRERGDPAAGGGPAAGGAAEPALRGASGGAGEQRVPRGVAARRGGVRAAGVRRVADLRSADLAAAGGGGAGGGGVRGGDSVGARGAPGRPLVGRQLVVAVRGAEAVAAAGQRVARASDRGDGDAERRAQRGDRRRAVGVRVGRSRWASGGTWARRSGSSWRSRRR